MNKVRDERALMAHAPAACARCDRADYVGDGFPAVPAANKTRDGSRHGQSVRTFVFGRQRRGDVLELASNLRTRERELEAGGFHELCHG